MEAKPPATPGHDDGNLHVRLQPTRVVDGMIEDGYTGKYEVICPACVDSDNLDYQSAPPEVRAIRGPYDSLEEGRAAAEHHLGYTTQLTRLYGLG
jgi:hypothetical protein